MANQNVNLQTKLLQKLNIFSKLSVKLVFLSLLTTILSLFAFVPISEANVYGGYANYAYPACYFKDNDTRDWKWGLFPDNNWFYMDGHWEKRNPTSDWKFFSKTSKKDVESSCKKSQEYDEVAGNPDGIYAREDDKNYDIVYEASTAYRADLDKIDLLDVWGEGRIITSDNQISGFHNTYLISKFDQRLSNESVRGPMIAKKDTLLSEIIDPEYFLAVREYENKQDLPFSLPIKDGIVSNVTVMGSPIKPEVAKEILRVLNKDNGRVILYNPDKKDKENFDNAYKSLNLKLIEKKVNSVKEEMYNEPKPDKVYRPIIGYTFQKDDKFFPEHDELRDEL
ncbi:hypothetical protein [Tolypothrix sp. VBCCA 56010]|uniref:hypothetical protein n=1 Tax=Tolypothrix sp. VBCCA 56010 TaxID=3137731 RepID=UPI003D7E0D95